MAIKDSHWNIVSSKTKKQESKKKTEKKPKLIRKGWFIEDGWHYDLYICTLVDKEKTHSSWKAAYSCYNRRTEETYIMYNISALLTEEKD